MGIEALSDMNTVEGETEDGTSVLTISAEFFRNEVDYKASRELAKLLAKLRVSPRHNEATKIYQKSIIIHQS